MSIFPTKILVATDGSEEAGMAATTAINLAKHTNSELHILTVGSGYPSYDVRIPEVVEELRRQAQTILDEQVKNIEQAGGEVAQAHLRLAEHHPGFEHHPSDDVVRVAEEIGAGLIVVGSRGLGGMRRALMGSVSDSVVRHAHCPVMVVRGEPLSFRTRILVATDGSREAELAATSATELAGKTGSELHVVHVFGILPWYPSYPEGADFDETEVEDPLIEEDLQRISEQRARELLDAEVEKIRSVGGNPAQAHLREGGAAQEIVGLAEEIGAGLIAMGSRGGGGIRRALMGSVSDSVVRHAHCPVLVVRPEK